MKTISRVILSAILLALTALLAGAAMAAPQFVFAYYPAFSRKALSALSALSAPLPFALWEALAVLLILWALYTLVRSLARHKGVLRWLSGLLLGFSAALLFFVAVWGLGHFGPDAGEKLGLAVRPYTEDELYDAAAYYAGQANAYAEVMKRDGDGVASFSDFGALASEANAGYAALAEEYDCFDGPRAPVKRLAAWKLYSYFGVTGIFVPFTGESGVNPDTFAASLPFTMCHELAHRLGFPAEDGANFCAYLACMANPSVEFRYSGAYSAFLHCYNALYEENQGRAAEIWALASEALRADCRAATAHYEPYEGTVQDVAQQVNDAYLKAFREEAGVKSYGEVADYLIAWYLRGQTL